MSDVDKLLDLMTDAATLKREVSTETFVRWVGEVKGALAKLTEERDEAHRDKAEILNEAIRHKGRAIDLKQERDAANAVIAEVLAQTKRGNVMTPPWVIDALNGDTAGVIADRYRTTTPKEN